MPPSSLRLRPLNHAAPWFTICGTLQSVSTLLTTVGLPHRPLTCGIRRLGARIGALAFERIEQRGLFPAHIAPGADVQVHLQAVLRAQDIPAQIALAVCFGDRLLQPLRRQLVRPAQKNVATSACIAYALTIMPSINWWGSPSSNRRSLNVPGSISSALQMRYLGRGASSPIGTKLHFCAVGNPAPPRPRRFDSFTSATTSAGDMRSALRSAA